MNQLKKYSLSTIILIGISLVTTIVFVLSKQYTLLKVNSIILMVLLLIVITLNILYSNAYQKYLKYYFKDYEIERKDNKILGNIKLFRRLDLCSISKTYKKDHFSFMHLEAGKSNIPIKIIDSILSRGTPLNNHLKRYFRGDFFQFKIDKKQFRLYYTNFLKEKEFTFIIENLLKLTQYKNDNHLYYTLGESLDEDILKYITKLNKKVSIYLKGDVLQIIIENKNSLLKKQLFKDIKGKEKVFEQTYQEANILCQLLIEKHT